MVNFIVVEYGGSEKELGDREEVLVEKRLRWKGE